MKIIFVNRFFFPDYSATSQMLSDLAFHLANRGWSVEVITSQQKYEDPDALLPKRECYRSVTIRRVATTRFGRGNLVGRLVDSLSFYFGTFFSLIRETGKGDVLVAKTDPPLISVVAALAAKLKSAKLVNWIQDLFPEIAVALDIKGISGPGLSILRAIRNWSLRQAIMNVVIGTRMKELVIAEAGGPEKIRVIHNWADANSIEPLRSDDNPLVKRWGLEGKFIVGYSGNMGRAHTFDTILDVAETLKHRHDIVFIFIGGGAKRAWIEQQTGERGLTNVLFKDYQPRHRLSQSLGLPDIHLVTLNPDLEGLIVPSKIYGIAAAGKPMLFIGDSNGEVSRMINDADCGVCITPGSTDVASSYILHMKEHSEDKEVKGGNARALFLARYSMEHAFNAWEEVLLSVHKEVGTSSE